MSKRFERVQRHHVRITARDLEVVQAVFEARYMTNRQIGTLFFSGADSSHGRQRLRYLFDLDYLRKRAAGPNEPDIYYLGLKGRRYLATLGSWSRAAVDRIAGVSGEEVATPALMMRHELTLSRLYVNARIECAAYGWQLQWKNTRMLEMEKLGIEPDAWIGLRGERDQRQAFLEFTAAMPSTSEMESKLTRYQAYWQKQEQALPVLWFTTSRSKANRLLESIRQSEYRDLFLVGQIEDASRFLTKPMWRWGDAEDGHLNDMLQWIQPPKQDAEW